MPRSFDYAGSLNDPIILNLSSPLLESSADSSFLIKYEKSANIVPIQVVGESIQQLFALMTGIYPLYSRFVKGIQFLPVTDSKKSSTAWQEGGARKDIEFAFGEMQACLQAMSCPFQGRFSTKISMIGSACLIMHDGNVCMSDRMMEGNVYSAA